MGAFRLGELAPLATLDGYAGRVPQRMRMFAHSMVFPDLFLEQS